MDPSIRYGSLNPADLSAFDREFPFFSKPTELGSFSLNGSREYCNDDRNLMYYVAPTAAIPNFDLSSGYDQAVHRQFGKQEKLDSMLHWISHNPGKVLVPDVGNARLSANFVCYRGLMTAIACTPYEDKNGWIIIATKYRGTIYLCAIDTEEDIKRRENMKPRDKLMTFWGYKFEQYMCADSPENKPTPDLPLNVCEEYNCVCKAKLGEHRLLFGAEVDCLDNTRRNKGSTDQYIELKTNRIITSYRQDENFRRFKLLKWWMQSFLIGIPKVICGFRNDVGIVKEVQVFETKELPKIAQGKWKPTVCFNFCDAFLNFVAVHVKESHCNTTYRFQWRPGDTISCEKLDHPIAELIILPQWYISFMEKCYH